MPSAPLLLLLAAALAAGEFPPVAPLQDQAGLGAGIQRTMTLLAESTPAHRNHVRVLFYGQSITEQDWSRQVADDLRRRFPAADLEIENRAIGGFAAQWLIRPAEHDVFPFYPDLVIFHVYGANQEYEQIIRGIRSRTTAEVLQQTDHLTAWPPPVRDAADLQRLDHADHGEWWNYRMNHDFLPEYAERYGCGLVDVRGEWGRYLAANRLEPKALLKDGVHLNPQGCAVMAGVVGQYLVHRPDLPRDPWRDLVRELAVGDGAAWKDGVLRLPFDGNRVDVLAGPATAPLAVDFAVDGRKPSEFPECRCITRPKPGPWSPLFIKRVGHDAPLLIEDWTLTVTAVAAGGTGWDFTVAGSRTGADGGGSSGAPFRSPSGRVTIATDDWFHPAQAELKPGFQVTWSVRPLYTDHAELRQADPARESAVTVAQDLANGPHVLEVRCAGDPGTALRAIRVYRPPVR